MYFDNCKSLDELKKEYRRLCMIHHPDIGGIPEIMKAINNANDIKFEELKKKHNETADEFHQTTETAEEFRDIISVLILLDNLIIELCGAWLWVSGDTKKHKDVLKAAGCLWSQNKLMWYWRHPEDRGHWSKRKTSIGYVRAKYGSTIFNSTSTSSNNSSNSKKEDRIPVLI